MSSKARNAEKRRQREEALMNPPPPEEESFHWQMARAAIGDDGVFSPDQIAALNDMISSLKDAVSNDPR
jgi:hypothetical protein